MRLEASMQQRLVQQMRLAPQIIQSIEILQLAHLDLQDLIQQELESNPLLEIDERTEAGESSGESDGVVEAPDGEAAEGETAGPEGPDLARTAEDDRISKEFERLTELEGAEGFNELFGSPRVRSDAGEKDRKLEAMQNSPARPASLPDHLYAEFCLREDADDRMRVLSREILYNLDERGFLRYGLEEIFDLANGHTPAPGAGAPVAPAMHEAPDTAALLARTADHADAPEGAVAAAFASPASLGPAPTLPPVAMHESGRVAATRDEAEQALRLVQQLEPRGVGARSLQECLLLQLDLTDPDYPALQALLTRHLDDVLKNRIPKIAKDMNLPIDEVNRLVVELKQLSIRPGSQYAPESSPFILPDVVVDPRDQDEGYEVRLEDDYIPPLRINGKYRAMLKSAKNDPQLREFLQKRIESARWLIDSIEQRRNTLLRVASEIVKRQVAFLDHGITHHRPLKMQEVADELGIHVSTVSRAISGKYAQTHRGIFPLKFFFSGGTESTEGDDVSRHAVKDRVEALVKGENPKIPLSDDDIAARLKDEGLSIARRTVTKYRKMLGIPSSRQRKVFE